MGRLAGWCIAYVAVLVTLLVWVPIGYLGVFLLLQNPGYRSRLTRQQPGDRLWAVAAAVLLPMDG